MRPVPPHLLFPFSGPASTSGLRRKPRIKKDRGFWMVGFPGTDRMWWSTGKSVMEAWKNFRPSHFAV